MDNSEDFQDGRLFCSDGESIAISKAIYGRMDSTETVCGGAATCARSVDVTAAAKTECNGKVACYFNPDDTSAGFDPCDGSSKYTQIEFSCVPG